jgi:hypothetical protein
MIAFVTAFLWALSTFSVTFKNFLSNMRVL